MNPITSNNDHVDFVFEKLDKTNIDKESANYFYLPPKYSKHIQNANKLHDSLEKAGLYGYFHNHMNCIVIVSEKTSQELQEILDDGTEYSNWTLTVQYQRDRNGNALVYL